MAAADRAQPTFHPPRLLVAVDEGRAVPAPAGSVSASSVRHRAR
jgi:hypothetical protein